jgi:RNA polymerase sigma factor (TIGR02999 family)
VTPPLGKIPKSPAPLPEVDAICDAFEAAWCAGKEPRIEDFLSNGDPFHQEALFSELLLAEWDLRQRHALPVELPPYLQRFSASKHSITALWRDWNDKQCDSVTDDPTVAREVALVDNAGANFDLAQTAEELLPFVYEELRKLAAAKLAQEKPGHTLQGTALVHEAFLRLAGSPPAQRWQNRGHFFAAAAEAMRRILVDNARRKKSLKHGGELRHQENADVLPAASGDPLELLAIHEGLDRLAEKSPRKAELVKLRFFLGCTMAEAAQILGIAQATEWRGDQRNLPG